MATALWEFGTAVSGAQGSNYRSGAQQIIGNFGVALASTIAGIFLRVLLHQMRVDPADVESMTRIELAEASKRVKAALDSVTGDMGRFHEEIRQRTEDVSVTVLNGLTHQLTEFTEHVTAAMQRLLETTDTVQTDVIERSKGITQKLEEAAESARQAIENLRAVEPPPLKLAKRLELVSAALETINQQMGELDATFRQTSGASSNAISVIAGATDQIISLGEKSRKEGAEVVRQISQAAIEFKEALLSVGEALRSDKALLAETQGAAADVLKELTITTREITALVTENPPMGRREHGNS